MWITQEIIYEIKPELIIETGTFESGSALYYSHLCDLMNNGKVITIDIEFRERRPVHPRLRHILGSSTNTNVFNTIEYECKDAKPVLILLDSDHSRRHVLDEMNIYSNLVTVGSYLIVEDTALNGHPIHPNEEQEGPMEAVEDFLKTNKNFVIDKSREKFLMTWHPNGFLKRIE